jgi:hypothetical protein
MKVTILGDTPDPEAVVAAFERVVRFAGTGDDCIAVINCSDRKPDGWLEYGISFVYPWGAQRFFIGMIQRKVGAEFEFHS